MIEKIKKGLREREVKVFLVFLFFSTMVWFISKLSNTFEGTAVFNLVYVNIPENQMLINASHEQLGIKLDALGFHFLGMNISNKNIKIDISNTQKKGSSSFILTSEIEKQIENQLPNSMKLIELMSDTLFFNFQEVVRKKVLVKPQIELNLAQNYLLDGPLVIIPDSVTITGPENQVDTINHVTASKINLIQLTSDFSRKAPIVISNELTNTIFSNESVVISGKVSKFSEKKLSLKIECINLPEHMSIKTFPDRVDVLCKGTLSVLKDLDVADFQVVVDYNEFKKSKPQRLSLILSEWPNKLYSTILEASEVEYILKRK